MAPPRSNPVTLDASRTLFEVLWWHAGWALALALMAGVLLLTEQGTGAGVWGALALGVLPAVGALALEAGQDGPRRLLLLSSWALMSTLACGLTGGMVGPLAAWCLSPLAAAAVLGGGRPLAQGASLSLAAFALVTVCQLAGWVSPPPPGGINFELALLGVVTIALGLASALLLSRWRLNTRNEAQNAANADLHAILFRQPHLIVTFDANGRLAGAYGLPPAGVDSDLLFDKGLMALASEDERPRLKAAIAQAVRDGAALAAFAPAGRPDVWLEADIRGFEGGRLIATLRDAGETHQRELGLEAARADAEALNLGKSRFLANMSHELRTPLNAIMGFSDIMRQRIFGELPGKYVEYADLIHDAGAHLLDLINDVLDMSKIEAARYELSFERADAREPVQAALRLMRLQADDAGVQLRGLLPGQPLEADIDRRAIKQIVLNLVSNALKFTPRGGLVTVSVQALAGALELSVADTGVGVSETDLARLGKPYEQAGDASQQAKGTGLGLSLVRAFAELHGGEMSIESRLGQGTAVTVRLPVLPIETPAV
ncbi:MAG: HAMP domain-containing histidine kinase [Caulobacteraceae bacterium]|nr:HAMP domain-containing histidine kinase [Caulobacteraceae bacterium]